MHTNDLELKIVNICYRLVHLFGISEESFLRVTDKVMDAMIDQIEDFIRWPTEGELALHAREFDRTGKFFPNIIGTLDDLHIEIKLTHELLVLETILFSPSAGGSHI